MRVRRPHAYLDASWEYLVESPQALRHRDQAGRVRLGLTAADRYLHAIDGKLRRLLVACSDNIWHAAEAGRSGATWRRTYLRNVGHLRTRMMSWVVDYSEKRDCTWYWSELLKACPAILGLMFVVSRAPIMILLWTHTPIP